MASDLRPLASSSRSRSPATGGMSARSRSPRFSRGTPRRLNLELLDDWREPTRRIAMVRPYLRQPSSAPSSAHTTPRSRTPTGNEGRAATPRSQSARARSATPRRTDDALSLACRANDRVEAPAAQNTARSTGSTSSFLHERHARRSEQQPGCRNEWAWRRSGMAWLGVGLHADVSDSWTAWAVRDAAFEKRFGAPFSKARAQYVLHGREKQPFLRPRAIEIALRAANGNPEGLHGRRDTGPRSVEAEERMRERRRRALNEGAVQAAMEAIIAELIDENLLVASTMLRGHQKLVRMYMGTSMSDLVDEDEDPAVVKRALLEQHKKEEAERTAAREELRKKREAEKRAKEKKDKKDKAEMKAQAGRRSSMSAIDAYRDSVE